jgi:acyl-coenzyme A synthetase/AMP-(fatty) acid ligase
VIRLLADAAADAPAIRSANHDFSVADLRSDRLGLRRQVSRGGVAVLSTTDAAEVAAAFVALDGWAGEVHLLPPGVASDAVPTDAVNLQAETTVGGADRPSGHTAGTATTTRWVLYTSGTTGTPKALGHTLASLSRTVATRTADDHVWGLLYDPNRMAGVQVLLQALTNGAPIIAPDAHDPLPARARTLRNGNVSALSATPSLWRQLLQLPVAAELPLRQVTLGGEIADQRVLDALARAYPGARIVHVFASTETGAAFSVRDGRAGFPASYLTDAPRGIRLDVRDGILHVHNPQADAAGVDGFVSTQDIVEIVDDRVLFRGRATGVVNVGGANVWPEEVESILRAHPAVLEAVVTAKENPMVGNVLVARVVLTADADPELRPKHLRAWVREHAPATHVPATVRIDDAVELSPTGKVNR